MKGKNKLETRLLGITKESIIRVNARYKEVSSSLLSSHDFLLTANLIILFFFCCADHEAVATDVRQALGCVAQQFHSGESRLASPTFLLPSHVSALTQAFTPR